MSRSSVASIALVAAAVTGAVMWLRKAERARLPAHEEVTRWEGEGGNLPDVAVETGNQGSGRTGKPAVAANSASEAAPDKDEPWPFPRS